MAEVPQPDALGDSSWQRVPPADSAKPAADFLDDRQRIQKAINERGIEALIQSGVARRVNNNDFNKPKKRSRYGLEGLTLDDGAILFKNNAVDESYIALYIPGGPHAGIRLLGATESRSEAATGPVVDLSPSPAPDTSRPPADAPTQPQDTNTPALDTPTDATLRPARDVAPPPPADTSATDTKAETHEPTPEEILNAFHADQFHEPFADFSLQRIFAEDPKKIDKTPPRGGGKWTENYLAQYRKEREVYLKNLQAGTATEREGRDFKNRWRIHASNLKNQFAEVYFTQEEEGSRYYGNRVLQDIEADRFIRPDPSVPQESEALLKVYEHLRDAGELDQTKAQMMKSIRLSIGYKALTDSVAAVTPWEGLLPQAEYSEMQQYANECARIADILLLGPTHSLEELNERQREILQDVIYEMRNEGDIEKAVAMETRLQKMYRKTPQDKRALWRKDIRDSLMTAYDYNLESAEGIYAAFPKLRGQRDELNTHALDSGLSGGLWMDRVEDYQRFIPLMIAQDSVNIAYDKQRSIKDDISREYQTQKQPAAVDLAYVVNFDRKSAAVAHYITLKQREQFRPLVRRACLESLIDANISSLEVWASFGYDINVRFLKDKDTFKALWRNMEDANNRPPKQRHNNIGHIKEGLQARIAMHPDDDFWKWCLEYVTERERPATTPAPVDTPPPANPPADVRSITEAEIATRLSAVRQAMRPLLTGSVDAFRSIFVTIDKDLEESGNLPPTERQKMVEGAGILVQIVEEWNSNLQDVQAMWKDFQHVEDLYRFRRIEKNEYYQELARFGIPDDFGTKFVDFQDRVPGYEMFPRLLIYWLTEEHPMSIKQIEESWKHELKSLSKYLTPWRDSQRSKEESEDSVPAPLRGETSPANPPADTSKTPSGESAVAPDATPPESSGLAKPVEGGGTKPEWTATEMAEIESYTKGYLVEFRKGSTAIMDTFPPDPSDKPRFEGFRRAVESFAQEGKQEDLRLGIIRGVEKLKEDDAVRYIRRWESVGGVVADILKDPALLRYRGVSELLDMAGIIGSATPEPVSPPARLSASREPVRATVTEPPASSEPILRREPAPTAPAEGEWREAKQPQDVARERAREILERKFNETHNTKYQGAVAEEALTRMILRKYHEHRNV